MATTPYPAALASVAVYAVYAVTLRLLGFNAHGSLAAGAVSSYAAQLLLGPRQWLALCRPVVSALLSYCTVAAGGMSLIDHAVYYAALYYTATLLQCRACDGADCPQSTAAAAAMDGAGISISIVTLPPLMLPRLLPAWLRFAVSAMLMTVAVFLLTAGLDAAVSADQVLAVLIKGFLIGVVRYFVLFWG